jgi:hypothetical protein
LPKPDDCPEGVWKVVLTCFTKDPKERPSFGDIVTKFEPDNKKITKSIHEGRTKLNILKENFGIETTFLNKTSKQENPKKLLLEEKTCIKIWMHRTTQPKEHYKRKRKQATQPNIKV